ncbi:Na+/H+ antiporter NhaA [Sphingomonas sp. S2-65]|uniref:Na+/H+ antiporter NhaA n=1 Tax=Sphingomonas sp. S2-65 TaxID=2903960 RepID=UPI0021BCE6EA|nr:Na+/H+ antiporter NhaA [Sphingomonas sp. S2-65]UYY57121.1 Na+/H+ antiporter NhaA [Sphingomonas sp. S2-65]
MVTQCPPSRPYADSTSRLHRLKHILHLPVGFFVVPIFGLANAAVPVLGLPPGALGSGDVGRCSRPSGRQSGKRFRLCYPCGSARSRGRSR